MPLSYLILILNGIGNGHRAIYVNNVVNRMKGKNVLLFLCAGFLAVSPYVEAKEISHAVYLQRLQADINDLSKQLRDLDHHAEKVAKQDRAEYDKDVRALWKKERGWPACSWSI